MNPATTDYCRRTIGAFSGLAEVVKGRLALATQALDAGDLPEALSNLHAAASLGAVASSGIVSFVEALRAEALP